MKHLFGTRWAIVILGLALGWSFSGIALSAADNHDYTLVWNPDDASTREKINYSTKHNRYGQDDDGMTPTSILAKNGKLYSYDSAASDKLDDPTYTLQETCAVDDKISVERKSAILLNDPSGNMTDAREYQTITGSYKEAYLILPGTTSGASKTISEVKAKLKNTNKASFNVGGDDDETLAQKITINLSEDSIDDNGDKPGESSFEEHMHALGYSGSKDQMKSNLENQINAKCILNARGNLTSNYQRLADTDKQAWDTIAKEAGLGDTAAAAGGTAGGTDAASTGVNCQAGSLGWLFCPLVNAMAKTVQAAANLMDKLMLVRFLADTGSGAMIEKAWRGILSLANLLLVGAFLFIILSQATSVGLSNYNIKRMLPRLVVAAILMNISFYICALAIDISNITGSSIMGFMLGSGNTIGASVTEATGGAGGDFVSGPIIGIAVIALAFFILIPVVLSIVVVFIVLVARQVILMVLVLLSPLAFVAWLLPNTEKHFKKWYEMFFQMLVLYPMVMFMFGASLYLATIVGKSPNIIGG